LARSEVEFGDLFTQTVREAAAQLNAPGKQLLFDCEGPPARLSCDVQALRAGMRRVLLIAASLLDDGFVLFRAEAALPDEAPGWRVAVAAAVSGAFVDAGRRRQILQELCLSEVEGVCELRRSVCPWTGGEVQYLYDDVDGCLVSLTLQGLSGRVLDAEPVDAGGARAWIVGRAAADDRVLERRLQRLGWATRRFDALDGALEAVAQLQAHHARPSLVIVTGHEVPATESLRALLPPECRFRFVQPAAAASMERPGAAASSQCWPLSPAELRRLTRELHEVPEPSGETRPAPLSMRQRRQALVVDDNPVNQLVASGMLQALGFEVSTADDGGEAIEHCLITAPDLVLMDLQMPGMDGLEATRRLRLLQQQGRLPGFPIVAATADTSAEADCAQAGLDGYLPKPLSLAGLEQQLQRFWPPA
jgi:CheY-like chemotaxis protein